MKKKEILAIKKNFQRFKADLKATQKVKKQLEEYLLLYSECMTLFILSVGETESLLDTYIPGQHQDLLNATKQMQETQMSFNLQYLQLQSQMQSHSYTAVSNIMKTKHDIVKNSISNIR